MSRQQSRRSPVVDNPIHREPKPMSLVQEIAGAIALFAFLYAAAYFGALLSASGALR